MTLNPLDPQNQQGTPLTEDQIRMMRTDLGQKPVEPTLAIPAQPVFDADEPMFTPNTVVPPTTPRVTVTPPPAQPAPAQAQTPQVPTVDELIAKGRAKKRSLFFIVGGVGLLALGALGYVVAPLLLRPSAPAQPVTEVVNQPTDSGVTPIEPTQPAQPNTPVSPSLFKGQPVSRATAVIDGAATPANINKALLENATQAGSAEVRLVTKEGATLTFTDIVGTLAPTLAEKTGILFEDAVSSFVFTDATGNWPGYVGMLKTAATPDAIKAWFTDLEKTTSKNNFFIVSPGTLSAFRSGIVNDKHPDRYAPGSTPGASFSYLIIPEQRIVVVATSFAGLKDALMLLGL